MRPAHYNTKYKNDLTPRERDVIGLVTKGRTNAEIAESLGIAFETVKTHVSDVLGKLNVESREEAAAYWRDYNSLGGRVTRSWNAILGVITSKWMSAGAGAVAIAGAAVFVAVFLAGRGDDPPTEAEAGEPVCNDTVTSTPVGDISWRVCEPGDTTRNLTPLILIYDCRDSGNGWDFEREAARAGFLVVVPELYTAADHSQCDQLTEEQYLAGADRLLYTHTNIKRHDRSGARPVFVTRGDGTALLWHIGIGVERKNVSVQFSPPYPEAFAAGFRLNAARRLSPVLVLGAGKGPYPAARSKAVVDDVRAGGGHAEYLHYADANELWREEDAPGAWEAAISFIQRELAAPRVPPASPPTSRLAVPASTADVDCRLSTFWSDVFWWIPARLCRAADAEEDAPGLLVMFGCDESPDPWEFELEAARAGFSVLVVDPHQDFAPPSGGCDAAKLYEYGWMIPTTVNHAARHSSGTIPQTPSVVARGQGATTVFDEVIRGPRWEGPAVLLSPEYRKGEVNPVFPRGYRIVNTTRPTLVLVDGGASAERLAQAELVVADIRAGGGTATLEIVAGADEKWTNAASMTALRRALEFLKANQ